MKKSQSLVLYVLILAVLVGFTGYFFSISEQNGIVGLYYQEDPVPETISSLLAEEEEVDKEESHAKKAAHHEIGGLNEWEPLAISSWVQLRYHVLPSPELEKKYLVHRQLLI